MYPESLINQGRYLNRDISWLQFNARVLHEAIDLRTPLLERVKFLQIFTTNLDEFFMKRVGGLKRQKAAGILKGANQQLGPADLIQEIRKSLLPLLEQRANCWTQDIIPALKKEGIYLLEWGELSGDEQRWLEDYFDRNLFPVLTPLSVDSGHPFPFISNLSSSYGLLLRNPRSSHVSDENYDAEALFARVKIPSTFPAWIPLPKSGNEERFISLKQILKQFLGKLFPGMEILHRLWFRITRNAELDRDEEDAEDLLEMITEELRERRFAEVVRLELGPQANPMIRELLKYELELHDEEIYENTTDIDFSSLNVIFDLERKELKYKPWVPTIPPPFQDEETSLFNSIRDTDLLVHHPYESFHHSIERFVRTASSDPKVLAIKMTLYRTGADSPFIPFLIRAAEAGKQVVCLVELKARFDEERNIQVARSLEKAGVHVVYGVVGLKTHCKVVLVVRQEEKQVRSYAHIGTGNYNSKTAGLYTDFGYFTAKPEYTEDVVQLFHFLTGRSLNRQYNKLLVAPIHLKTYFLKMIQFEAEEARSQRPARIIAKMNSLEDVDIIQALYDASQAGVSIDLIVRGFCCLKPQVPGLSENIRVISIIGRFLEHCRIFHFQHGFIDPFDGPILIGSADWMHRNLTARVEVVAPIEDKNLKKRLFDLLQVLLQDQRQAWVLQADGNYQQKMPTSEAFSLGTHDIQIKHYEAAVNKLTQLLTNS
ncbi:MAG: polyphosphate kinase 1 [Bdellovibrionia bacterium]